MPQQARNGDRLDSWKAIAAYLDQGVRTAQRWEREESLPVYRPSGKTRGTVFAFPQEIDDWYGQRAGEHPGRSTEDSRWKALPPIAAWGAAALLFVLLGSALVTPSPVGPPAGSASSERLVGLLPRGGGAISPDGQFVAHTDANDGRLYLRNLSAKTSRLLVADKVYFQVAWSRDGRQLAYACERDGKHYLEALDLKSGKSRVLRTGSSLNDVRAPVEWFPAGNELLCSNPAGSWFGVLSLETLALKTLETPASGFRDAALSPDGRFLAYTQKKGRFYDIALIRTSGQGDPIPVTSFAEGERFPVWSHDGRTLLFTRTYGLRMADKSELWAVSFDPEGPAPSGEAYYVAPATNHATGIRPTLTPSGDLVVARREPASRVRVLEVDPHSGEPLGEAWSDFPDASSAKRWSPTEPVLYYWDPSVRWQVLSDVLAFRERNMDTGHERIHQIPWPKLRYEGFAYSRDHTKAVFKTREPKGGPQALHLYDAANDELSKLVTSTSGHWLSVGRLSNDAKQVAFGKMASQLDARSLRVVDVATRSVRTLYRGGLYDSLAWSADDAEIAFTDGHCLLVVGALTGESDVIACAPEATQDSGAAPRFFPGSADWSPDGAMLAWPATSPQDRRRELWVVDRKTGGHRVIWEGGEDYSTQAHGPAWSPDGRFISFTVETVTPMEIWALPNLLTRSKALRLSLPRISSTLKTWNLWISDGSLEGPCVAPWFLC